MTDWFTSAARAVSALGFVVAGCSPDPATMDRVRLRLVVAQGVVCRFDAIAQPVVVALAVPVTAVVQPLAVPVVQGAVMLDGPVHKAIQDACQGGDVVGVVPADAPAAPAK